MAEPNNDPHVIDDEDLEDGEIDETDEENDVIIEEPKPAPKPVIVSLGSNDAAKEPSAKKAKVIDEEKPLKAERKIEKNVTVNSKKSTGNDAAAGKMKKVVYKRLGMIKINFLVMQMIGWEM